jgi:hypothetical protein
MTMMMMMMNHWVIAISLTTSALVGETFEFTSLWGASDFQ